MAFLPSVICRSASTVGPAQIAATNLSFCHANEENTCFSKVWYLPYTVLPSSFFEHPITLIISPLIVVSSEEKISKDDAAFFEKIIRDFGVGQEKVVVFEDSLFAMKTAKKAGCRVIGIYDDFSRKNQEEIRCVADFYGLSWQDIETCLFEGKKWSRY